MKTLLKKRISIVLIAIFSLLAAMAVVTNGVLFFKIMSNQVEASKAQLHEIVFILTFNLLLVIALVITYIISTRKKSRIEATLRREKEEWDQKSVDLEYKTKSLLKHLDYDKINESSDSAEYVSNIRETAEGLDEVITELLAGKSSGDEEEKDLLEREQAVEKDISSKRNRLILMTILLILSFTMIVSIIISTKAITSAKRSSMEAEVKSFSYDFDSWVVEQKNYLDLIVEKLSANPAILEDYDTAVEWIAENTERYEDMAFAFLGNPDAEHPIIMGNGWEPEEGWDMTERPWYSECMEKEEDDGFNICAPFHEVQTNLYCITFSKRVYDRDGNFLGVFGIDYYLEDVTSLLRPAYSKEGYEFMVDKEGRIIYHPNKSYELSDNKSTNISDTVYASVMDSDRTVTIKDYDGKKKAVMSFTDEISGFTIVGVKNWSTIYGGAVTYDIMFIILFGVCIAIILYLIVSLMRWQAETSKILKESVDEATKAGQAKIQFLAQMSHEIRTPINAILGMDEMILRESSEDEVKGYAHDIRSAGNSLLQIINDILDMSKIDSGKLSIVPVKYDLSSILNDLINMVRFRAESKKLALEVEIDEKLPSQLYGDEVRFKQIITNVLTNAVKYTHEGTIWFRVSGTKKDEKTETLHVEVEDTGIGIREEDLSKLFAAFERIDEQHNRNIEGTGLGMHITQRLLNLMGSKLQVESTFGEGSKFYFDLDQEISDKAPIGDFNKRISKSVEEFSYEQSFYAPNARILVVDDNSLNRKVFVSLLKDTGAKITEADSGKECLKLTSENYYDIIFLDHMMPEMDGIETLHHMKEDLHGPNRRTPVFVLTANAVTGAKEMYLNEGFNGFLAKPIDAERLEQVIASNLAKNLFEPVPDEIKKKHSKEGGAAKDKASGNGKNDMPEFPMIGGVDWSYAWSHLHSEEIIMMTVKEFIDLLPSNIKKLETAFDKMYNENVCDDYRIQVHSMKSVAATIGIIPLAGMANVLEYAARDERVDDIKSVHPVFVRVCKEYGEQISEALGFEDESVAADKEIEDMDAYKAKLDELKEAMEDLDVDTADAIVDGLLQYKYTEQQAELVKSIKAAVTSLDEEEAVGLIDELSGLL